MDITQLQYFISVRNHLSFSLAAKDLHVVQATVSRQIAKLEEELGVQLFERDSHSVKPTAAGILLAGYAPVFIEYHNNIVARVKNAGQGYNQTIRIGVGPYEYLLFRKPLQVFAKMFPNITLDFTMYTYYVLMTRYRNGVLDIGACLDCCANDMEGFQSTAVYDRQWQVIASEASPLWDMPPEKQSILYDLPVITQVDNSYEPVRSHLTSRKYQHKCFFETNFLSTQLEMVQSNLGVAVVPPFVGMALPPGVRMGNILKEPFAPSFQVAYPQDNVLPVTRILIDLCSMQEWK